MSLLKIGAITGKALRDGVFAKMLPQIEALRCIIENNAWHHGQTVLDHTAGVVDGLERVFDHGGCRTLSMAEYLNTLVEGFSRYDLLRIAALLHDVGKPDTLVAASDGTTSCPGHEEIGSVLVPSFAKIFGLGPGTVERVAKIVRCHGFAYTAFTLAERRGNPIVYRSYLQRYAPDIYVELLLLHYADVFGGNVPEEQFISRTQLLGDALRAL